MASKVKVEKFDKINRSKLSLSNAVNKTRTGQLKGRATCKAHGKMSKHK